MLSPELREVLLHGPRNGFRDVLRYGGAAHVRVQWRRHREELMAACPPGRRPWGYWMVERRLKTRPAGELGELRVIRSQELWRDDGERELVLRRLSELTAGRPQPFRPVAAA